MNFSIKELNELLYSLGTTASKGMMVNKELNSSLIDKLYGELSRKLEFYDFNGYEKIDEEVDEPEFDSAGFSVKDREPNQSELDAIQQWLKNGDDYEDWDWDGKTLTIYNCNGGIEKYTYQDLLDVNVFDNTNSHFVSNEEADEDYRLSMLQDEQRYEDTFVSDSARTTATDKTSNPKKIGEGTAQALLDYVDMKGAVSHKELHEYYKSLNGSNTFSWCLRNLTIPYKNRKTQRYLAKEGLRGSNAKYVVKIANPSNWVVVEDDIVTRICDFNKF